MNQHKGKRFKGNDFDTKNTVEQMTLLMYSYIIKEFNMECKET